VAKSDSHEKNGKLNDALAALVTAQAILAQTQAETLARTQESIKEIADLRRSTDERFARIERILLEHSRILDQHTRILEALPDAVRQTIGFRPADQ
jgi:hypothetical protein